MLIQICLLNKSMYFCGFTISASQKLKVLQPIARVKSQNHTWALRWNFTAVKFDWKMSKLSNIQPNISYCLDFFPPKTKFIFFFSPWRYSRVPCYYFVPWRWKLRWYSRYVEQGACDMAMVKRLNSKTRSTMVKTLSQVSCVHVYTWVYSCLLNHDRIYFQEISIRAIHSLPLLMMKKIQLLYFVFLKYCVAFLHHWVTIILRFYNLEDDDLTLLCVAWIYGLWGGAVSY